MKYCVIGRHGLLGGALAKRLGSTTSVPTKETRVLFHFGSYTHLDFEENPHYLMKQTLDSFTTLLPYCYEHGILFVYPSSALVYEKETQFTRYKKTLELLVGCYSTRSLGLRIFPVYGPGENRTVISQWCKLMSEGKSPIVYGDGNQTRDFIHVTDVVHQILELIEDCKWTSKIADIGTGVSTSFNHIIGLINGTLGTNIQPQYVQRPSSYSEGIVCANPLRHTINVEHGIHAMLGRPCGTHCGDGGTVFYPDHHI